MEQSVKKIDGNLAVDDRGTLRFINDFAFEGVKRFYQVENHESGFCRAFHGHRKEGKYVYVAKGAAIVAAAKIVETPVNQKSSDCKWYWEGGKNKLPFLTTPFSGGWWGIYPPHVPDYSDSPTITTTAATTNFVQIISDIVLEDPEKFVLSSEKPSILYIPPGYANGFKTLTEDTILMFFSTSTLEESKGDDIRFDWDYFGCDFWKAEQR